MANFTAVKTGGWSFEDPITHDQISTLQQYILKCPNFAEGGSYYPTNQVVIGGAGMLFAGDAVFNADALFSRVSLSQGVLLQSYEVIATNNSVLYADINSRAICEIDDAASGVTLAKVLNVPPGPATPVGSVILVENFRADHTLSIYGKYIGSETEELLAVLDPNAATVGTDSWGEFMWYSGHWNLHRFSNAAPA